MYICPNCYSIYHVKDLTVSQCYEPDCLNKSCECELIQIDEPLADVIVKMWKKGIKTKFCCSGHLYEKRFSPYIVFDSSMDLSKFKNEKTCIDFNISENKIYINYKGSDVQERRKYQNLFIDLLYFILEHYHETIQTDVIDKFSGPYHFLSNFYCSSMIIDYYEYKTVEHYYQANKANNFEEYEKIRTAQSPQDAKKIGKRIIIRDDWEKIKVHVMRKALFIKFQNPELKKKLLDTDNITLIEGNSWNDTFWGICNGVGENILGKLLMEIRDKLRQEMGNK